MQKKYFIILAIFAAAVIGLSAWTLVQKGNQQPTTKNPPPSPIVPPTFLPTIPSSTQSETTSTLGLKIYRNEQFGFEFRYPQNWVILENSFGGYYTKFNVVVGPSVGTAASDPSPFLVNIVLPEFADRTFLGPNSATSTVTVAGTPGIKYEYEFEGLPETAIVLPFGQYKIIFGSGEPYQKFFDQIVPTFKFLK